MSIARALCGVTHVTITALFCSSSLLCISNSDWATENEAGRSVSVNGNEEPAGEMSPIQCSCNCSYSLITHNKTPVHSTWGLLRVCAACPTPRLNLSSEVRPSGNNIQDTFPTGSAQNTTQKLSKELGKINGNWTRSPTLNQLCLTLHFFIQNKGTEAFAKLRLLACSSFRIWQWDNRLLRCRLNWRWWTRSSQIACFLLVVSLRTTM